MLRRIPGAGRAAHLAVGALLVLGTAGCAATVEGRATPALRDNGPVHRVAVVPLRARGALLEGREPGAAERARDATTRAAHQLSEALAARGIAVVAPEDVARALGGRPGPGQRLVPAEVARLAAQQFGADGVLLGEMWRFVDRSGQAAGSRHPASVGFEVTLYAAPGGQRLWTGTFDETQRPLGENVLATTQYPGRGTRWLTGEELLRWGAGEIVRAMPVEAAR